jgi:hypothetical protein
VKRCTVDGVTPHPLADSVDSAFGLFHLCCVLAERIEQRPLPAIRRFKTGNADADKPHRAPSGVGLFHQQAPRGLM